jgi:hypothetical protein
MDKKMRPEDKIVEGLVALGQVAMGLNEYVTEKINEKMKPCGCKNQNQDADIKQIIQAEIRAYLGKHNFVTEEELAALRKVVNQIKSARKTKPKG